MTRFLFRCTLLAGIAVVVVLLLQRRPGAASPFAIDELKSGFDLLNTLKPERSNQRIWTDIEGRRISADILDATASTVTLRKTSDGRTYSVSVLKLCEADRAFVERWRTAN